MTKRLPLAAILVVLAAVPAYAHIGVGAATGFLAGAHHPLSGLDHILAMTAVGIWAASLGGRALWAVPLSFITAMVVGGSLGIGGVPFPFVEFMIGLSVIALGALVALKVKVPVSAGMAIVAAFALAHGHAHGTEMPITASGIEYGAGFVLATAFLHVCGVGLGIVTQKHISPVIARIAGVVIATLGLSIVFAG